MISGTYAFIFLIAATIKIALIYNILKYINLFVVEYAIEFKVLYRRGVILSVRGWVYVISNKAMPGLIKVGYTLKDPILRANELDNTGSPHPYDLQYEVYVHEPLEIEQRTHKELKNFNVRKEWFNCSLDDAVNAIRKTIGTSEILLEKIIGNVENYRFVAYDNGTVLDTNTNLMWAAKDNGSDINWRDAKSYCENYHGGGYTDWRLPTLNELEELYTSDAYEDKIKIINYLVWASETRGLERGFGLSGGGERRFEAAYFNFGDGQYCDYQSSAGSCRALPVRAVK
jgi:hypothetical protein